MPKNKMNSENADKGLPLVPLWYVEAKQAGCSVEELQNKVREFCQTGTDQVDEGLVQVMFAMYEYAYDLEKK